MCKFTPLAVQSNVIMELALLQETSAYFLAGEIYRGEVDERHERGVFVNTPIGDHIEHIDENEPVGH